MNEDADVTGTTDMSFGCSIINKVFHFSKYEIKCMTIIQKIVCFGKGTKKMEKSEFV